MFRLNSLIPALLLAGFCLFQWQCSTETPPSAASVKNAVIAEAVVPSHQATLEVKGMTCAMGCAKSIEKALSQTHGVHHVKVDFEEETAWIEFDEQMVSSDELVDQVESINESQYTVGQVLAEKIDHLQGTSSAPAEISTEKEGAQMSESPAFTLPDIFSVFADLLL